MDMNTKQQESLLKKTTKEIHAPLANTEKDKTVCPETKLLTCGAG